MPRPVTLSSLAYDAYEALEDKHLAVQSVIRTLQADRLLFESVVAHAVEEQIAVNVESAKRSRRAHIFRAADRGVAAILANGFRAMLLDMPLADGTKLRDADHALVLHQVALYETQARDMDHKARWLKLIGDRVPLGRTVGEVVSDAEAQKLWDETKVPAATGSTTQPTSAASPQARRARGRPRKQPASAPAAT